MPSRAPAARTPAYAVEWFDVTALRPHPRNYKSHPPDQLAHIQASLQQHGFYRNIVVAQDLTILAGHAVVEAATALGLAHVPGYRLAIAPDSEAAFQVLIGDNEIQRLGMTDDAALTMLLQELHAADVRALEGTGFDVALLQALVATHEQEPPTFEPVGIEEQGRLDQQTPLECPACGHTWVR